MKDLRGKHAVLTGASRGLGPYIACALAQKGVNLALTARTADAVEATAKEASALGVKAIAIPMDVTDQAGRERLLEGAVAANGPIDILINNAGIEWVCEYTKMSAAADRADGSHQPDRAAHSVAPRPSRNDRAWQRPRGDDVFAWREEGLAVLGHLCRDQSWPHRVDQRCS